MAVARPGAQMRTGRSAYLPTEGSRCPGHASALRRSKFEGLRLESTWGHADGHVVVEAANLAGALTLVVVPNTPSMQIRGRGKRVPPTWVR